MLRNTIPEIYLNLFPKSLLDFKIEEKKATCDKCALSEGRSPDKRSYKPNLKCCTFQPFQTNYLMGQILSNKATPSEVLERIKAKIQKREYVFPIGIIAPIPHQIQFANRKDSDFGNRADWLCPYYNRTKDNCGIWKSRSSVCTSFHCLSSYGTLGFEFWDSLSDYISYAEMALMEEVLLQLDFSPREISEQISFLNPEELLPQEKKVKFVSASFLEKIWKDYYKDEIHFYKKCYEIIQNLSERQFKKILGEQGLSIQKKVMTAKKAILL
ncbi:MAG: hypothetical protein KBF93_13190 [Leptospiraceae bacterium]|nr:hypothetical protein [Leptospiraceae bacterium]